MPDTNLTADIIAKECLAILDNELDVLESLYRGYEDEFSKEVNGYRVGDTISIRRPADYTVRTTTVASNQDTIEGKVTLAVDKPYGVDFSLSTTEKTLDIKDLSERRFKPAMVNLRNKLALDVMTAMYQGAYNWVGTPGQTINSFTDFLKGPERLDEMAVPMVDRSAVLSPADYYGMLGTQAGLYMQDVAKDAYRRGKLGDLSDVSMYKSQVVPTHTVGAHGGTPRVDGASQNVTYDTAKNTWTQTLITDGWSTSVGLKAGDVFTIADVFMVNPKTKQSTGILQQFVITTDVTTNANAANDTNLTISPAIITSGPYQTVNAAPVNDALITYVGTASTAYKQNMVYHKNAMALVVVPRARPDGVADGLWSRKDFKGLSLTVEAVRDGINDTSMFRIDLLAGFKLVDPRLITRISGSA